MSPPLFGVAVMDGILNITYFSGLHDAGLARQRDGGDAGRAGRGIKIRRRFVCRKCL